MSFANPVALSFPTRLIMDWRRIAVVAGTVAMVSIQSATFAAVLWLIVAAPGLLG